MHHLPFDVLLVDSDTADAGSTRQALEQSQPAGKTRISHVSDDEECLRFLRRQEPFGAAPRPDVILLDVDTPGMEGEKLLLAIKDDAELRRIPVVVLSTSCLHDDVARSYMAGANSFVLKPTDFERMVELMRMLGNYWFNVVKLPR